MVVVKHVAALAFAVTAIVSSGAGGAFRIMTYNIRHGADVGWNLDIRRAGRVIDAQKPRFAGLQEVDQRTERVNGLDSCRILERETGMHATYAKAIDFAGGEYGNALLSREKPLAVRRIPLPGGEERVLLMCEFPDCWVGVTHLAVDSAEARDASVAIMEGAVRDCGGKPVFLMGDWNSSPDSPTLAGMRRFMKVLTPEDRATFHGDKPNPADFGNISNCIDYIAVDCGHVDACTVLESSVIEDRRTSDHAPVVAEVDLGGARRPKGAFTMATFNVRCPADRGSLLWYKRMPRIAEIVRDKGFDIFGVQEAVPEETRILDYELPGFGRVGCGRGKDRDGEAMLIFYRKSRFEVVEDGTFWLSETPDEPGSRYQGAGCPRTCTWALVRDKSTGRMFRYFNTHLDHISPQARIDGMRVLLDRGVRPAKARGETVFLTGDLNDTLDVASQDSPESIAALCGPVLESRAKENPIALISTELADTYGRSETPHEGPHKTFHGFTGDPRCRIDYIFSTPDVRVLDHATLDDAPGGEFASDHYPVCATVVVGCRQ